MTSFTTFRFARDWKYKKTIDFKFIFHFQNPHFQHQHQHHDKLCEYDDDHCEPVEVVFLPVPLGMLSSRASTQSLCSRAPSEDLTLFIIPCYWLLGTMMIQMLQIEHLSIECFEHWTKVFETQPRWIFVDNIFWQKSQDMIMTQFCHLYGRKCSQVGKLWI